MYRVPFLEPCSGCSAFTEIETEQDYLVLDADNANIGDVVSCSMCECTGVIDCDEEGRFVNWEEELCEHCMLAFEKGLEILSDRLIARIRG